MPFNPFELSQTVIMLIGYTVVFIVLVLVLGLRLIKSITNAIGDFRKWFEVHFLQAYMAPMKVSLDASIAQQVGFASSQALMAANQKATTEALLVLTHRVDGHDFILGVVQGRLFGGPISPPLAKDLMDVAESIATDDLLNNSRNHVMDDDEPTTKEE